MTPVELTQLENELNKVGNWSHHRKAMHGISALYSLSIPTSTDENARATSSLVTSIIKKMLEKEHIKLGEADITTIPDIKHELRFVHQLHLKKEHNPQYIFHKNAWIELLDQENETFALIVTGGLSGKITFYSLDNGELCQHHLPIERNGVFKLDQFSGRTLLFTNENLAV